MMCSTPSTAVSVNFRATAPPLTVRAYIALEGEALRRPPMLLQVQQEALRAHALRTELRAVHH